MSSPGGMPRSSRAEEEAEQASFGAFNLDGSNRDPSVNNYDKLINFVGKRVLMQWFNLPPFSVFSEVPGANFGGKLVKGLDDLAEHSGSRADYYEEHFKAGNAPAEHLMLLWDNSRWKADRSATASKEGKYLSLKLTERTGEHRRLHLVAVHLPHKSKRQEAYRALTKHVEEGGEDCDSVVVAGDFNCKQDQIAKLLPSFALCIPDGIATTTKNTTIDNIAVNDGFLQLAYDKPFKIFKSAPFHHHPFLAMATKAN